MYRIHLQFYCRRQIWEEKMGSFSLVAGWRHFRFLDPVDPINLKFINLKESKGSMSQPMGVVLQ